MGPGGTTAPLGLDDQARQSRVTRSLPGAARAGARVAVSIERGQRGAVFKRVCCQGSWRAEVPAPLYNELKGGVPLPSPTVAANPAPSGGRGLSAASSSAP